MDFINLLLNIPAAIVAITIHQFVLAKASSLMGDPVPYNKNRITLNPTKQIDPFGFIIMCIFSFGWAKPVETSPLYYKNRKRDTLIVYISPIIASVLLGFLFLFIYKVALLQFITKTGLGVGIPQWKQYLFNFLQRLSILNFTFAISNLVPVYPMDGAKILSVFVTPNTLMKINRYEKILQIVFMFLIITGILGNISQPILNLIYR